MALSEIIQTGMNNPECSFFVGTFVGQIFSFRSAIYLACIYLAVRTVDGLCLNPLINWIKAKYYKEK